MKDEEKSKAVPEQPNKEASKYGITDQMVIDQTSDIKGGHRRNKTGAKEETNETEKSARPLIIPKFPSLKITGSNITIRRNIDKNVINRMSIQTFKVPNFSLLTLHVERKPLDSQIYLVSVKISEKEPSVPTVPKIRVNVPTLVKLSKDIASVFKFSKSIPRIPSVLKSNIYRKPLDKRNYLMTIESPRKESNVPDLPKIEINFTLVKLNKDVNIVPKNEVKIPLRRVLQKASTKIGIKSLDKTIFIEPSLKPENEENSTKNTKNNNAVSTSDTSNLPSSILTMLFESDDKKYSIEGLIKVKPDRPVIIVAIKSPNDDYIATLLSLLREIYRMKVGGLPIVRYIGTKAEKNIVEDEPIRQGFIKVIDDSEADILKLIDRYKLKDRLTELSGQGLSFLVFYVNEDKKDFLLTNLSSLREKIAPAKIVVIKPSKLTAEQKRELARVTWGYVDPEEISNYATLDKQFKLNEDEFNNVLEKIATKREYAEIVREGNEVDLEEGEKESESPLHYQLKAFIVHYLIEKENIPRENIETESNKGGIIPDIYVNDKSKKWAIEVETFYGTGITPWRKLERTVEKYIMNKVTDEVNEVWIVIPPLQTMLYLNDLVSKIKDLKGKGYNNFIKFYTVDLSKIELVSIEEIPRKISEHFPK